MSPTDVRGKRKVKTMKKVHTGWFGTHTHIYLRLPSHKLLYASIGERARAPDQVS